MVANAEKESARGLAEDKVRHNLAILPRDVANRTGKEVGNREKGKTGIWGRRPG